MKFLSAVFATVLTVSMLSAQTPAALRDQARAELQQGDFDKAIATLNRARRSAPASLDVLKDLTYTYFLKRDFAAAIEVGKQMVELPDADQQSFQLLGMNYKAIAAKKEAEKLYKAGLQKFPKSGVIYNEYGEMYAADQDLDEAVKQWEKGIEADPNYSSNYFNAAMYYDREQNWLRAVLYGETFLNLESFSKRTDDLKPVLYNAYRRMLAPGTTQSLQQKRGVSAFEKDVLSSFAKAASAMNDGGTVESITRVRKQFLADWARMKQTNFPYRLFDHQQQLVNEGLFEAYDQWLFSTVNANAYKAWQDAHTKEAEGFKRLQESKVYKIPSGQYYF